VGLEVRPTGAKVRQALFNILGQRVHGAHFLDLFAGSGLIGLEALSRGAESLIAVDENRKMTRMIESNVKHLGYQAEVITADVRKAIPVLEERHFSIVFADPPYKNQLASTVVQLAGKHQLLSDHGLMLVEHARNLPMPDETEELTLVDRRIYGQTAISFYGYRANDDIE
jgi:16S rRNA (guanine(966)-N(2))-methyltransferase RsmD